jgi:glycosyltransferase involved in cell wall biosynthesis
VQEKCEGGITAFFPCYNDAGTIATMVILADMSLRTLTDDYEIVVIDDGSSDASRQILRELQSRYDCLRLVFHEKNKGYGGALRSGFAAASKELIFYTDGDAQYDPQEVKLLVPQMKDGIDWVNGYKIGRSDPIHRKVIGTIYNQIVKLTFGLKLRDVDCDFRLIKKSMFDRVTLNSDSGVICVEMITKFQNAGFVAAEVPVHHYHRAYGSSQFFNFRRLLRVGVDLLRLWWKLVVKREYS